MSDDLGHDPYLERPRRPNRHEVAARLNRMATVINALHLELSELRRELRVEEAMTDMADELSRRTEEPG